MTYNSLKACPKCQYDAIFLPMNPAAGYDGRLYGSRSEGFCNSPQCDQLLWYYPSSGRVTRRHVGMTLAEYQDKQNLQYTNLRFINIMRRLSNLSPVMEVPDKLWGTIPVELPSLSLLARLRRGAVGWFWWIVAALKSPFVGELTPNEVLITQAGLRDGVGVGALTINGARKLSQHPQHGEDSDAE